MLNVVVQIIFPLILQIWYVEVQICRSISESPLEFEITRVDCMLRSKGVPIIRKLSALVGAEPTIVEQLVGTKLTITVYVQAMQKKCYTYKGTNKKKDEAIYSQLSIAKTVKLGMYNQQ